MKHLLFSIVLASPFISLCQSVSDTLIAELSQAFQQTNIKGMGIAIVDEDGVLLKQGFGFADLTSKRPYTTSTFQPIGSISKTFLGVSLMKAQELGMLTLNDDVNDYLPFKLTNPNHPDKKITIKHLATHTASIRDTPHYEKAYIFREKLPENMRGFRKEVILYNTNVKIPLADFLERIYATNGEWYSKKSFSKNIPGETYEYSNNGAALACMIISKASGIDYQDFVKKHILDPLAMNQSGWKMYNVSSGKKATLYSGDFALPDYELITYADGGFVTSVEEFATYFIAIIQGFSHTNESLLNNDSFHEMLNPQHESEKKPGIFWVAGDKRIGHTGGDPGLITVAYFNREDSLGIVLFTNTNETKTASKDVGMLFRIVDKFSSRIQKEIR